MKQLLVIFSTLSLCSAVAQKLPLNQLFNGTVISDVEFRAGLYVSSSDDVEYLKNIMLSTSSQTISCFDLLEPDKDGNPIPMQMDGFLTVTTKNAINTTLYLNGLIYITTATQQNTSVFSVILPFQVFHILANKVSMVVLNTGYSRNGITRSAKSIINRFYNVDYKSTSITIRKGFPTDDEEKDKLQTIFQNPIYLTVNNSETGEPENVKVFFESTQPLLIDTDIWYFIVEFPFGIDMGLDYSSTDRCDYLPAGLTTTGIITNEFEFSDALIHFDFNPTVQRYTGYRIITELSYPIIVSISADDTLISRNSFEMTETPETIVDYGLASLLNISSNNMNPGKFYLQYFSFNGYQSLTSTTKAEQTTTVAPPIITTTKDTTTTVTVGTTSTTSITSLSTGAKAIYSSTQAVATTISNETTLSGTTLTVIIICVSSLLGLALILCLVYLLYTKYLKQRWATRQVEPIYENPSSNYAAMNYYEMMNSEAASKIKRMDNSRTNRESYHYH